MSKPKSQKLVVIGKLLSRARSNCKGEVVSSSPGRALVTINLKCQDTCTVVGTCCEYSFAKDLVLTGFQI
jgi:hypothetical protein